MSFNWFFKRKRKNPSVINPSVDYNITSARYKNLKNKTLIVLKLKFSMFNY